MHLGRPATSQLSAAFTLVNWISAHGRAPMTSECKPENQLLSFMTYYRHLPGSTFSAIISAAIDMVSHFRTESVSAASSTKNMRLRKCLGSKCTADFPYQGPQIAFCPKCRRRRGLIDEDWWEEQKVSGQEMRRLGLERDDLSDLMEG